MYGVALILIPILLTHCINPQYNDLDPDKNPALFAFLFLSANSSGSQESAPTKIYMYARQTAGQGNFGDRAATSNACTNDRQSNFPALACRTDLSFLSYSTGPDLLVAAPVNHNVPTDVPIVSPTENTIEVNWAALWDGSIQQSVNAAGVAPSTNNYWTGTTSSGIAGFDCQNWSSPLNSEFGTAGFHTNTDALWVTSGFPDCSQNNVYLCVCW